MSIEVHEWWGWLLVWWGWFALGLAIGYIRGMRCEARNWSNLFDRLQRVYQRCFEKLASQQDELLGRVERVETGLFGKGKD